MVPIQV